VAGKSAGFAIGVGINDAASAGLDAINKRIAALTAPAERFNKSLAKFGEVTGINRAAEGMQTLGDRTLGAARAVERLAGPMAGITSAASLGGMVELGRSWADAGTAIGKTANLLNTPVDRLSALRGAARLAGSSADAMDSSLRGLSETLHAAFYNRDATAQMNLKALGIDWRDARGNITTVEAALGKLADKVSTYRDKATAGRALSVVGVDKDLLPLLEKGQAGLDAFVRRAQQTGGVMTADMAANARKMNASWTELGLAIEGVGNRIVDSWSGTAAKVIDTTSHWIERNQALADSYAKNGTAVLAAIAALSAARPAVWILRALGLLNPYVDVPAAVAAGTWGAFKGAVQSGTEIGKAAELGLTPTGLNEFDQATGYRDASGRFYTPQDVERMASHRSFQGEGNYQDSGRGAGGSATPMQDRTVPAAGAWLQRHLPAWLGGTAPPVSSEARHNPLNLRFAGQSDASPTASGFGAYASDEAGIAAAEQQLLLYRKRGITRLRDIIRTWAPASENDTAGYLRKVSADTGWSLDQDIDVADPGQAGKLAEAMAIRETHRLDPAVVGRGVAGGLGETLNPAVIAAGAAGAATVGRDGAPGAAGASGHVQVDVHLHGVPHSTTATVIGTGAVRASPPRIEHSMPMVGAPSS